MSEILAATKPKLMFGKDMWPVIRDLFGLGHLERVRECRITVPTGGIVSVDVWFYAQAKNQPEPPQRRFMVHEIEIGIPCVIEDRTKNEEQRTTDRDTIFGRV